MLIHDDFIYVLKMVTFQFAANNQRVPSNNFWQFEPEQFNLFLWKAMF